MSKQVQWGALAVLISCSLHALAAPTWKKGMAIPVVTEGSVCKSATDKIAVTSTNEMLSCQWDSSAGAWKWLAAPSSQCPAGQTWSGGACRNISTYASSLSWASCYQQQNYSNVYGNYWSGTYYCVSSGWHNANHICCPVN